MQSWPTRESRELPPTSSRGAGATPGSRDAPEPEESPCRYECVSGRPAGTLPPSPQPDRERTKAASQARASEPDQDKPLLLTASSHIKHLRPSASAAPARRRLRQLRQYRSTGSNPNQDETTTAGGGLFSPNSGRLWQRLRAKGECIGRRPPGSLDRPGSFRISVSRFPKG